MNHHDKGNLRTERSRVLFYVIVVVGSVAADRRACWLMVDETLHVETISTRKRQGRGRGERAS